GGRLGRNASGASTSIAMRQILIRLMLGLTGTFAGIYFREFWLSKWGLPTLVCLIWLSVSLIASWNGRGKPFSFRFGIVAGSSVAGVLLVFSYVHHWAAYALLIFLIYCAYRTGFWDSRAKELDGR